MCLYIVGIIYAAFEIPLGQFKSIDTYEYIDSIDIIMRGEIDVIRTPVYPLFVGPIHKLFGESAYLIVNIVHHVLLLLVFYPYYRMLSGLIKTNWVVVGASLMFVASPYVGYVCNYVQTEALALMGITIFTYLIWRILCDAKLKWTIVFAFSIVLIFLLFLRPQMLYLLPVCVLFVIVVWRKKGGNAGAGILTAVAVPCVLFCVYCYGVSLKLNVFTPSVVGFYNKYDIMRENDVTDFSGTTNLRLKAEMENIVQDTITYPRHTTWYKSERDSLLAKYPFRDLEQMISTTMRNSPELYIHGVFKRIGAYDDQLLFQNIYPLLLYRVCRLTPFSTFGDLMTLMIIVTISLMVYVVIKRKVPWLWVIFYLIVMANIASTIIGAQGEWARLCQPTMPVVILLAAKLLSYMQLRKI